MPLTTSLLMGTLLPDLVGYFYQICEGIQKKAKYYQNILALTVWGSGYKTNFTNGHSQLNKKPGTPLFVYKVVRSLDFSYGTKLDFSHYL